jgi:hypothetical protein
MGSLVTDDARVFLGRLTRLNPAAVVRFRPAGPRRAALWGRVPWGALVTRDVDTEVDEDVTVAAAALLASAGELPERRDRLWRWPLPPDPGRVVEELPARQVRELAAAAAGTLREVTSSGVHGRAVGVRKVREALLDHVAIVVEPAGDPGAGRINVPQRLVQAAVRMGFVGAGGGAAGGAGGHGGGGGGGAAGGDGGGEGEVSPVRVRVAGAWVGLAAYYGTAWLPPAPPVRVGPLRPA